MTEQNILKPADKYMLSLSEASSYFNIGENKLRNLVNQNPNADFVLWNGSHVRIKRILFERFLDQENAL